MRHFIVAFISVLASLFIVFFTNITNTLAFRELAVEHGVSLAFPLLFIAISTLLFATLSLIFILVKSFIDSSTNELINTIESSNKSVKDTLEQHIIEKYNNLFNKISTIVMYDKNIVSLLEILSKQIDVIHNYTNVTKSSISYIEDRVDKLLALSNSPANELPIDILVLPKPVVMKVAFSIVEVGGITLTAGEEVTVTAIKVDDTYVSGIACETDKGWLDMGLLVR
jgi:hypothetical protein